MEVELKPIHQKFLLEVELQKKINNILLARSKWKNKFFDKSIWSIIFDIYSTKQTSKFKKIKFFRSSHIPKCYSGLKLYLHKGKISRKISIHFNMVGKKFGEFAFTRKPFFFPKKNQKLQKKR